ncbi:Asp-tRNA(Asn)/Glu-tRNA(Gln) amidotransferase subunit GatB [Thermospira aquatica]|uniref:Aspartyl/glutamyl-tRNA(Asn/Gln) amidotransferase subunit B n=1 Tax=Thermospira aquatica TaxID=2828656 RepID=A0AAX3BD33_9SPIR|nr:Asp-tRNA(Asn)/Glu-tRNA(Gln) amidotransferase subunit GatB [Thermospira aquatica]URA10008.1 Asp-tRNA(Asn)/Glu-tRNA(Gln) amidotransferase subunit GatB [Thermospira aquatica]
MKSYEAVIGLEVHVQLNTKTKIFCGCSTEFGAPANTHVCPVCMGQPGVLPVLNEEVLHKAILAGLAIQANIAEFSKFDRKNYFYPDLPKGYQISQYDYPICQKGAIEIVLSDGTTKRIGVTRIHMEEDAGKSIHLEGEPYSAVDLNRAGVPLLEIVSEPDMRSSEEAYLYLKELRSIMKYLEVSDVNMEEGSLRCDVNVSVRPVGQKEFGTKVEIKNLNSFNGVKKAIEYEIERQIALLENGEKIIQETRLYDAKQNKTFPMRDKEEANDYRYFPEPDLPPLRIGRDLVEKIQKELPELPQQKRERFVRDYGITLADAEVLTEEKEMADYFEDVVRQTRIEPKKVANWIQSEVMAVLNELGWDITRLAKERISSAKLADLMNLIQENVISGKMAKDVFAEMVDTGESASVIVEKKGLKQITDTSALETLIDDILSKNPQEVQRYREGKKNLLGFFVGEVMKATKGQANPKLVNEILQKKLG